MGGVEGGGKEKQREIYLRQTMSCIQESCNRISLVVAY